MSVRLISGDWADDKAAGKGKLEYSNGDLYDGEWANDQRSGMIRPLTLPLVLYLSPRFTNRRY